MNDTELLAILKAEKSPEELLALAHRAATTRLAGLLHTLLCPLDHKAECDYYIEEETTGQSTAKMEWYWRTSRLLTKARITPPELELLITRVPGLVSIAKEPCLLRFLSELMPALRSMFIESPAALPGQTSSSQSDPSDSAESPAEL
jgi:hypothetical protein